MTEMNIPNVLAALERPNNGTTSAQGEPHLHLVETLSEKVVEGKVVASSDAEPTVPSADGIGPILGKHLDWYRSRGIPVRWDVEETNARSIHADPEEYPSGLEWAAQYGDAIVWDYAPVAGLGWSQCRPTNPPVDEKSGRPRKYLGNSGKETGERLILNQTMSDRLGIGEYTRVIFVEGTGQTKVAQWVYRNDESTLIVGVPGCWGWSKDGISTDEIVEILKPGGPSVAEAFVVFDADVEDFQGRKGNPKVWLAGKRLEGDIEGVTGKRPRFLMLPASADKAGLDDFCAAKFKKVDEHGEPIIDATEAREYVDNLLRSTNQTVLLSKNGPKPSREVELPEGFSPIPWKGDSREAEITKVNAIGQVETVARFVIRIAASYEVKDHLNHGEPDLLHDVEILFRGRVYLVRDVWDSELGEINRLLRRAGIAHGSWKGGRGYADFVVEIMKFDAVLREVHVGITTPHMGQIQGADNGLSRWATPSGMVTAEGLRRDRGKAHFERGTNEAEVDFSCMETADAVTIREAWETEREVLDLHGDATYHVTATGHAANGAAGNPSEGGIFLVGRMGGGKTAEVGWQTRRWGKHYRAHVLPGQSEANGSDIGQGLDCTWAALDDFKPFKGNRSKREQAVAIIEMLGRRAGDGEGEHSGRTGKRPGPAGKPWLQGNTDRAHPAIAASGEEFPLEMDSSTKQRWLTIKHSFRGLGDNFAKWKAIGDSGKPNLAMGTFLQFTCIKVDETGGIEAWKKACWDRREEVAAGLAARNDIPETDHRCALVAAGRVLGWYLWVEAGQHFGAWDEAEAERLKARGLALIEAAMAEHYRAYIADGDSHEDEVNALLDDIRDVDYRYNAIRDPQKSDDRAGRHGWIGQRFADGSVALIPSGVADATDWDKRKVQDLLRTMSGDDAAKVMKIDGKTVRAYTVPQEVYEGTVAVTGPSGGQPTAPPESSATDGAPWDGEVPVDPYNYLPLP